MENKVYYSISEVAEMFNVNQSLIRFWEKEFCAYIKPKRNKRGVRFFTKKDIESISIIYDLVKVQKYTLEGAKKELSNIKKSSTTSTLEKQEEIKQKKIKEKEIKQIEDEQKTLKEEIKNQKQKNIELENKQIEQQKENEKIKADNSKLKDKLLESDKRMESLKYNHRAVYDKLVKIQQLAEQILNKE